MHAGLQPRALGQRDGRMEQPFEDAGKAMTSQVPRAGVWCDGGHHDMVMMMMSAFFQIRR